MSFHSKPTMKLAHPQKKYRSYQLGSPFSQNKIDIGFAISEGLKEPID